MRKIFERGMKGCVLTAVLMGAGVQSVLAGDGEITDVQPLKTWAAAGLERLEWGLLLEAEGFYANSGHESESDLALATVEFTADAAVNDWLSGHVGLLWEEDDTEENNLDEAYITMGNEFYARVGRFYLPFGNFESAFISDPLTLELAEINQSSVMVGYVGEGFQVSAGAFKGETDSALSDGYAAITFTPREQVQAGAYWLSDLMETDSQAGLELNADRNGGAGAFLNVCAGPCSVCAEVVSALDQYEVNGESGTPMAYSVEVSVDVAESWTAGAKFEGSEDLYAGYDGGFEEKYHGRGYGAVVSYGFHENAAVGLEYLHMEKLDDDADSDLVTLQLAFEI